jgi:hypothetical protein
VPCRLRLSSPDDQPAVRVDRRPGDLATGSHLHGNRLAGQQRLVDGGLAVDHDAVSGDLFTRPDDEPVTDLQLGHRNDELPVVAKQTNLLRTDLEEFPDRRARVTPRATSM